MSDSYVDVEDAQKADGAPHMLRRALDTYAS
jgi:hypothetical protein